MREDLERLKRGSLVKRAKTVSAVRCRQPFCLSYILFIEYEKNVKSRSYKILLLYVFTFWCWYQFTLLQMLNIIMFWIQRSFMYIKLQRILVVDIYELGNDSIEDFHSELQCWFVKSPVPRAWVSWTNWSVWFLDVRDESESRPKVRVDMGCYFSKSGVKCAVSIWPI